MYLNKNIPEIQKSDFDLKPTSLSIARVFEEQIRNIVRHEIKTGISLKITHKDVFYHIAESYLEIFKEELPFTFEAFKKYRIRHRREI